MNTLVHHLHETQTGHVHHITYSAIFRYRLSAIVLMYRLNAVILRYRLSAVNTKV